MEPSVVGLEKLPVSRALWTVAGSNYPTAFNPGVDKKAELGGPSLRTLMKTKRIRVHPLPPRRSRSNALVSPSASQLSGLEPFANDNWFESFGMISRMDAYRTKCAREKFGEFSRTFGLPAASSLACLTTRSNAFLPGQMNGLAQFLRDLSARDFVENSIDVEVE